MTEDFYLGNKVFWEETDLKQENCNFEHINLPPLLARVLKKRGFNNPEEIKAFLKPSISYLHDPMLLPDMKVAVDRIITAGNKGERIIIYGDYDVDGITATSILFIFLKSIIHDVSFYIPDRIDEGYGISADAVSFLAKNHFDLMITVDCGISAKERLKDIKSNIELQNRSMDVIITDHHQPDPENIPEALAIINPHLDRSKYPFSKLCGAGVAFKLVQALCQNLGLGNKYLEYIDLAALGTVADIVSLTGENRIIVRAGINKIKKQPNPGIEALIKTAGISKESVDSWKLAFLLAPRINAAGRMGDASRGVRLFTTKDSTEAEELAEILDLENSRRQKIQEEIFNKAVEAVEADPQYYNQKVVVACGKDWHHGVIGIVASLMAERYHKPCFVISVSDEEGTCSARSSGGFSIYSGMEYCSELLEKYGGHEKAGGLTIKTGNTELFIKKINEYAAGVLPDTASIPIIKIDAEAFMDEIDIKAAEAILAMSPFGEDNENPVFRMKQVPVLLKRRIGAWGEHLKLVLGSEQNHVQAVAFRMGEMDSFIQLQDKVDIVFTIGINEYRGTRDVQLIIRAIRKPEHQIQRNRILLEAAERVECLDYNEDWLYNGINNKKLCYDDVRITRDELALLYRYLAKCGNLVLNRTGIFRMVDEISRNGSGLNYFKLMSGLFIFDELDIVSFSCTDSGEYCLKVPDNIEKVSLESSMLYMFLQSMEKNME
jgi:single-stranded-DNA-specific exonuclease